MKKFFTFMLPFLPVLILSSCEDPEAPDQINGRLATSVSDGATTSYDYDSEGRLTRWEQTGAGTTYLVTIQYGSGTVTWTESFTDSSGTQSGTTIYTLNGQGLAASDNSGNTYTYNADGNQTMTSGSSGSFTYTWVGGNNTVETAADSSGTVQGTTTKTYLTDKVDYRDYGLGFMGKPSKNLISSSASTWGGSTQNATYTYEYDSKGRVSKETMTYSGSTPSVTTYTYED